MVFYFSVFQNNNAEQPVSRLWDGCAIQLLKDLMCEDERWSFIEVHRHTHTHWKNHHIIKALKCFLKKIIIKNIRFSLLTSCEYSVLIITVRKKFPKVLMG